MVVESLQVEANDSSSSLLRVLDTSSLIFGQLIRILKTNWKCLFSITFLATAVEALLELLFMLVTGGYGGYTMGYATHIHISHYYSMDGTKPYLHWYSNLSNRHPATVCLMIVNALIVYVMVCLAKGAVVQTVAEMYAATTRQASAQSTSTAMIQAYGAAGRKGVNLVTTCLLISLIRAVWATLVGLLGRPIYNHTNGRVLGLYFAACSLLGTFVTLFTHFLIQGVMVESKGVTTNVPRSFQLLKGNLGITFFIIFLYKVVRAPFVMMLSWIQWVAFGSTLGWLFLMILTYAVNALFLAINTIVATVVYFHIRAKDEQLGPATLAEEMGLIAGGTNNYTNMDNGNDEKADLQDSNANPSGETGNNNYATVDAKQAEPARELV